jgi:hypothetical protein
MVLRIIRTRGLRTVHSNGELQMVSSKLLHHLELQ